MFKNYNLKALTILLSVVLFSQTASCSQSKLPIDDQEYVKNNKNILLCLERPRLESRDEEILVNILDNNIVRDRYLIRQDEKIFYYCYAFDTAAFANDLQPVLQSCLLSFKQCNFLEIGAAAGTLSIVMGLYGASKVYINDICHQEINKVKATLRRLSSKQQQKFETIHCNCLELPKKQIIYNSIHIIYASRVIHFFNDQQLTHFFTLTRNLLIPGGVLYLNVAGTPNGKEGIYKHQFDNNWQILSGAKKVKNVAAIDISTIICENGTKFGYSRFFSRDQLRTLLTKNNFQVEEIKAANTATENIFFLLTIIATKAE